MSLTSRIAAIAVVGALALAGIIGFSSFNSAATAQADATGERVVLHRGNGAEPSSLDPHKASGTWENNIIGDMFLGLYTNDAAGEPILGAAQSHTISEDGLTHTFIIREGHVWSDGVPVTAYDFEFAMRRILDPATAAKYASILYLIENAQAINSGELADLTQLGVHALDERTLEIVLARPAPFLPYLLSHYTTFAVPRHVVEEYGDAWSRAGNMVSNGAYTLAEWVPNDHITLVKNELFFDADNVQIDEVIFYPTDDESAALRRFRAGELDMNTGFPAQQYAWLQKNMPVEARVFPYFATSYILINMDVEPFGDIRIRRALSMAVDRDTIAYRILATGQVPTYSLNPPGMPGYDAPELSFAQDSMDERFDAARILMEQAGYGPDNMLKFEYRYMEGVDARRVAVALAGWWHEIYVDADIINTEPAVHYADLQSSNFELGGAGWIGDYPDPENYLFLFDSASGALNYSKYANPEYEALLAQAAQTADADARRELYYAAEELVLAESPFIPYINNVTRTLVGQQVVGYEDNAVHIHRTRFLSIDESKRTVRESFGEQIMRWFN